MPNNLNIEKALFRDFKAYFESPGEGLTAMPNVKHLRDKVTSRESIGTFMGVLYSTDEFSGQSPEMMASGYKRTTFAIKVKTYMPDDKNSDLIEAEALKVNELMYREGLASTLTGISLDQTYISIQPGQHEPGNEGKHREYDFSFTIIHKVSK